MAVLKTAFVSTRLTVAALLVLLTLCLTPAHARVFSPELFELPNGLRLVIVKNTMASAVGHMVWYGVGAADETDGKTGLAHYLEHMMFKGTPRFPSGAFHKVIAARGGDENAFTSHDETVYYQTLAPRDLGLAMLMEADRMRNLSLDPVAAAGEKQVVLSERQQRTDNDPHGIFAEKVRSFVFPEHPYGRPVIGRREDIERLGVIDLRLFYASHYRPSNAVVVVTGPVETQEVLRLAAAFYGQLPKQDGLARAALPAARVPSRPYYTHRDSRIAQPYGQHRFVVPSLGQDAPRAYALEVLAEALGGGEVGRLHRHFVMDTQKAGAISVSYNGMVRGPASFSISFSPRPEKETRLLAKEIETYMTELARTGLSAAELRKAKQRLQDSAIFARDDLMAPARIIGSALSAGLSVEVVENWPDRIAQVTHAEVNAALRALVSSPYRMTAFLEPESAP